jgi:DNA-binding MarR family transcriptional regulator
MISSGGLTDRLNRLTKAGLIRRAAVEGDGRSLPVELTEEGTRRAKAAFQEDMAIEAAMLAGLTEEEQRDLARLLKKLALTITGTGPFD